MLDQDQARWVTYAEAGKLLGVSAQAARMLAKRRGWARRTPNAYGDRALVLVPADAIVQPRAALLGARAGHVINDDQAEPNGHDQMNVRALEGAVEALREQLGILNQGIEEERARADRERERADRAAQQIETLRTELAEIRIAERVATTEANDLFRRLDEERTDRRQALDRLAAAQERIAALLTDQRLAALPPARRSWWSWRRARSGA
jgi:hypothetical protein